MLNGMRRFLIVLSALLVAVLVAGSTSPAQADAAKKQPTACAAAKAKAKQSPTAARKRAATRACASKRKQTRCQAAKAKARKKPTAARKRAARKACRKASKKQPAKTPTTTTPTTPDDSAPAPTTPEAPSTSALEQGVIDCANRERAARGIAALRIDPSLTRAAQGHAADMAQRGYFDHETPEGRTPWDRIKAALQGALPFRAMGENIAMGYRSAEATCTGWMNSPGHKRNILDPTFTLIGAGWVDGYAVQNFGDR